MPRHGEKCLERRADHACRRRSRRRGRPAARARSRRRAAAASPSPGKAACRSRRSRPSAGASSGDARTRRLASDCAFIEPETSIRISSFRGRSGRSCRRSRQCLAKGPSRRARRARQGRCGCPAATGASGGPGTPADGRWRAPSATAAARSLSASRPKLLRPRADIVGRGLARRLAVRQLDQGIAAAGPVAARRLFLVVGERSGDRARSTAEPGIEHGIEDRRTAPGRRSA